MEESVAKLLEQELSIQKLHAAFIIGHRPNYPKP